MNETIAAVATPFGQGALAVIRLSGAEALPVAGQALGRAPEGLEERHAHRAKVHAEDGVVLDDGGVNEQATVDLRCSRVNRAGKAFFDYGAGRDAFEMIWTEANYTVLTAQLQALPVHWRFFVKHRVFEAMEVLDISERKGDGTEGRTIMTEILENYPQLQLMT